MGRKWSGSIFFHLVTTVLILAKFFNLPNKFSPIIYHVTLNILNMCLFV